MKLARHLASETIWKQQLRFWNLFPSDPDSNLV